MPHKEATDEQYALICEFCDLVIKHSDNLSIEEVVASVSSALGRIIGDTAIAYEGQLDMQEINNLINNNVKLSIKASLENPTTSGEYLN